ncbi:hypothetical protein ONZ45_g5208 [Pleurotus djamor]|nr:hypothetical protein ONZ45_g5208 [Pleurotus djamor]
MFFHTARVFVVLAVCSVTLASPAVSVNQMGPGSGGSSSSSVPSPLLKVNRERNLVGCSAAESDMIDKAIQDATTMVTDAWAYFERLTEHPDPTSPDLHRYKLWFGEYTPARYKVVRDRFYAFRHLYQFNVFNYRCNPKECGMIQKFFTFARCYPENSSWYQKVDLCRKFFEQGTPDSERASTLVHEASHYSHDFYTGVEYDKLLLSLKGTNSADPHKTEVYGYKDCAALASNPAKNDYAVANADNYGYFLEYPDGCPPDDKRCVVS